jgi:glycogen phosphorylase
MVLPREPRPPGEIPPVLFKKLLMTKKSAAPFAAERNGQPLDDSVESLVSSIRGHLKYTLARDAVTATRRDWWHSASLAVRDRILQRLLETQARHHNEDVRRVYYLSLEYLIGRLLNSNVFNLELHENLTVALAQLGQSYEEVREEEVDMGLGNGGLGRLAACFLDSLATLDLPAIGYGIRYEYGLFRQEFVNGHQIEHPDSWIRFGSPWEIVRPEYTQTVQLYGHVDTVFDDQGVPRPRWTGTRSILGVPYDIPVCGYGGHTVNFLRLWSSKATEEFDFNVFNQGGYVEAVREKAIGETISKVLYPNDKTENGRELRLVQQYFFVACSLRDVVRRFRKQDRNWDDFPAKVSVQLNDTHPAVAVAELMRLLIDEEGLAWEQAWKITTQVFAYTNHTLMPEALERWSVPLFNRVLPRHLQIIFEINHRVLELVAAKWPGDHHRMRGLSLIEEGHPQMVRMAHLAVVASHSVNGVAAIHSELLRRNLFPDFDALFPGRFNNKTNGITPRRWLLASNHGLSALVTEKLGKGWVADLDQLRGLEKYADDKKFQKAFMAVKRRNKEALAALILEECGVEVSPDAIFDVQIKRLHEYKRQHLNLLNILALYRELVQNPDADIHPRVFIFAAKAAPGYDLAKTIIKAINSVALRINHDPRIQGKLKVVFLPNYRVSLAARIIPAADVSEQISTAGTEASGTGNMKLALNGALTVGTLDGANIEIREEVGEENIFIFGHTVEEVQALKANRYSPWERYHANEELRLCIDWIGSNFFTPDEPGALNLLRHSLLEGGDPYLVLADFPSYRECQRQVDAAYRDQQRWARMAILNTARVGKFSSDRTIRDYARDIWKLKPSR